VRQLSDGQDLRRKIWRFPVGKKLFYRIGEACKQLDIQPYVLRYWETEFPVLSPRKSKAGQRVYSEEELQLIQRIKQLLYEEGYTIAGAKKKLEAELAGSGLTPVADDGAGDDLPDDGESAEVPSAGVSQGPSGPSAEAPSVLDTEAGQQVERLRSGLREALSQAREILRLLP
jgi:DNA-binding transcriptional MerR regulator